VQRLTSAFYGESIQITFGEWLRLLFGGHVGEHPKVGLWSMPENGCPCENCRAVLGPLPQELRDLYARIKLERELLAASELGGAIQRTRQ